METNLPRFLGRGRVGARFLGALLVGVLPAAALAAGSTTAVHLKGGITGGAKLLNPAWNEAKDPNLHRFTFREPSPTVRSEARTLTGLLPKELCIVVLGADHVAASKTPRKLVIAGGRTTPVTLVIPEGQQVEIENGDPFPHKLYDTGNKGLPAAEIAPAKTRAWTPPGPGKYELRDETTPSVRSWVVVEPRAMQVTYPDRKGAFALDLAPGTYKLRAYFSGEPVGKELEAVVTDKPSEQTLKPLVVGEGGGHGP